MSKRLKVGLVASQPFGASIGTDIRINGLAIGLSSLGVEIHIITPSSANLKVGQGIHVHRVQSTLNRLGISDLASKVSDRFMHYRLLFENVVCRRPLLLKYVESYGKQVYKIVRKLGLDIIQAEQQIASLACIRLQNEFNTPIIADFHGIWAEEAVAAGLIRENSNQFRVLSEIEQEIACSANAVTVVSEEMKTYIENLFGVPAKKVVLIPNATFPRVENAKASGNPSKIIHSGTLHPWENIELFVQAMPHVLKQYPSAKFYLTRKGAKLNKIRNLAQELGVAPKFSWFSSEERFYEFLKSCDIGVISSTTSIARKMGYPAKLYDYLSVGLPIVANEVGAWTKIIKENKVGIVTDNNPNAFANGILEFLENPRLLHECGQRGIELVKRNLNYYRSAEELLRLYNRIA